MTVDDKGFVWVAGRGRDDDQILKFTNDGKFVMQIGHAAQSKGNTDTTNLNLPADVTVYSKTNEVFVADGYGNRRVIVFTPIPANSNECGVRLATCQRIPKSGMCRRAGRASGATAHFLRTIWRVRKLWTASRAPSSSPTCTVREFQTTV